MTAPCYNRRVRTLPLVLLLACAEKPNGELVGPSLAAPPPAERDGPLDLGQRAVATTVKMKSVDGRTVSIADVKGEKGTLVVFTCNHCPWARAWEQRIVELANTYLARGVGVIAINPNDPTVYQDDGLAAMKARAEQRGMKFPYVVDATSDVARAYGASKTPEVFLFDAGDALIYYGAVDDNAESPDEVENRYLADALEALVTGKPVAVAYTKAMGCSIKFRPKYP
jgi:peroxiredoxin